MREKIGCFGRWIAGHLTAGMLSALGEVLIIVAYDAIAAMHGWPKVP